MCNPSGKSNVVDESHTPEQHGWQVAALPNPILLLMHVVHVDRLALPRGTGEQQVAAASSCAVPALPW